MNPSTDSTATLPLRLTPIGYIRSSVQLSTGCAKGAEREAAASQASPYRRYAQQEADLVIQPELEELLDGVEEYSHLMVLYWPHLLDPAKTQQRKIHPMGRSELPLCGVFATRTPGRPNPVLVTVVKLLERKGNVLRVQGLEAVDGSPIIDIKPHSGRSYLAEGEITVPQWMQELQKEMQN
ncbi:MAG: tRNA (N6-threonylcarbamoyladenosine(37)-N6)-methyltransferase TrmO [Brachymonas sp.]|nr:tRNA (N6-threonylcarbamoyladenosine(37)-N6)-methyltransferase TrmO [Brachymonas sp.]